MFSALPVAILAWVFGSTSGLTRIEMSAVRPLAAAIDGKQFELRLGLDIDAENALSTASASSRAVLPTPENMILSAGMPAARARSNSPSETTSAPAPSRARVAITA